MLFLTLAVIVACGVGYKDIAIALADRQRGLDTLRVVGFSHRELAYAAREATLFAGVFWNLELPLDGADRVAGRYLGVTLVHP